MYSYLFNQCFNLEALIFGSLGIDLRRDKDDEIPDYNYLYNPNSDLPKLKIYVQKYQYDTIFSEYDGGTLNHHSDKGVSFETREALIDLLEYYDLFGDGLLTNPDEIAYID